MEGAQPALLRAPARRGQAIPAANERAAEIEKAEDALAEFDAKFEGGHYPDYTRKLFLIDRCLHGVDIQPIAVQIAKLRCFISLAVEQRENPDRPNPASRRCPTSKPSSSPPTRSPCCTGAAKWGL